MQHHYTADFGDFVKLALIRSLAAAAAPGVVWYLVDKHHRPGDGRHVAYLDNAPFWRDLDPTLFDSLRNIVTSGERHIRLLSPLLPHGTPFFDNPVPCPAEWSERPAARRTWLQHAVGAMERAGFVFLDPDNGLASERRRPTHSLAVKSVLPEEIMAFRGEGRPVLLYHHHSRRRGGHLAEIDALRMRLQGFGCRTVDAMRSPSYSPRCFLLLNGTTSLRKALHEFASRWGRHGVTHHPDPGSA